MQDQDLISIQEVRAKVNLAYAAWTRYRSVSQSHADQIVEAMAAAARTHAQRLAERAVEETGYGNARDKFVKNMLAADVLAKRMRGMRTLGVLREVPEEKIVEIGVPMGVVAAILPTTNPTSTAIYKTLIALKAGNGIVLAPHPRARACTCETASVLTEAAVKAGAPEGLIQCLTVSTIEGTNELMRHRRTASAPAMCLCWSIFPPTFLRRSQKLSKESLSITGRSAPASRRWWLNNRCANRFLRH